MGLNLETLIGILVILILLILADGVRRMIRERHGRLRMRIDRRFGKGPAADDDSDDDYPNELIGRPRVRSREEQARIDMDGVDEDGDRADPPGFIEAHKLRAMLTAVNMVGEIAFAFSPEVVGSTMRFLGVENESDDSVRISEMLRSVLSTHTPISHAGPHARATR